MVTEHLLKLRVVTEYSLLLESSDQRKAVALLLRVSLFDGYLHHLIEVVGARDLIGMEVESID